MDRKELLKDTSVMTGLAAGCGAILAFVVFVIVYFFRNWQFFARPENQHYTNYNAPQYINNWLMASTIQSPVVIIAFLIPFVVAAVIAIRSIRAGDYDI